MKKVITILSLFITGFMTQAQMQNGATNDSYTPITQEQYNKIEDLLNKQAAYIPIVIKDVPRDEVIKFYIQSYDEDRLKTFSQNAYKVMLKENLLETNTQIDEKFKALLKKEQTKSTIFEFLTLMSDEQILAIGY